MSNWDRNIAERKVEFTAREIYKLIRDVSPDVQAEIIVEVLCNEDSRINDAVGRWLSENGWQPNTGLQRTGGTVCTCGTGNTVPAEVHDHDCAIFARR